MHCVVRWNIIIEVMDMSMANVDLGSGKAEIIFRENTSSDTVNHFLDLLEGFSSFAECTDFEIRSSKDGQSPCIIVSAQGGWSPLDIYRQFGDLAAGISSVSPEDTNHILAAEIYCASYDWESNYRDIAVKQSGSTELSVYIHEGIGLSWHQLLHKVGCFELAEGDAFENDNVGASIRLVEASNDVPKTYLFDLTAQASYGLVLCTEAEIIAFLEEPDDGLSSLQSVTELMASSDYNIESIDEWVYSNEIKDDLLSAMNMYVHDHGPFLSSASMEKAISLV